MAGEINRLNNAITSKILYVLPFILIISSSYVHTHILLITGKWMKVLKLTNRNDEQTKHNVIIFCELGFMKNY